MLKTIRDRDIPATGRIGGAPRKAGSLDGATVIPASKSRAATAPLRASGNPLAHAIVTLAA